MNLKEFLKKHNRIHFDFKTGLEMDVFNAYSKYIDFSELSKAIEESPGYLASTCSLKWMLKNYKRIVAGEFKTFERAADNKRKSYTAPLFGCERTYTKGQFDNLLDDLSAINLRQGESVGND